VSNFPGVFWLRDRNIAAGISLFGGKCLFIQNFAEFQSCALCRTALFREVPLVKQEPFHLNSAKLLSASQYTSSIRSVKLLCGLWKNALIDLGS